MLCISIKFLSKIYLQMSCNYQNDSHKEGRFISEISFCWFQQYQMRHVYFVCCTVQVKKVLHPLFHTQNSTLITINTHLPLLPYRLHIYINMLWSSGSHGNYSSCYIMSWKAKVMYGSFGCVAGCLNITFRVSYMRIFNINTTLHNRPSSVGSLVPKTNRINNYE